MSDREREQKWQLVFRLTVLCQKMQAPHCIAHVAGVCIPQAPIWRFCAVSLQFLEAFWFFWDSAYGSWNLLGPLYLLGCNSPKCSSNHRDHFFLTFYIFFYTKLLVFLKLRLFLPSFNFVPLHLILHHCMLSHLCSLHLRSDHALGPGFWWPSVSCCPCN